MFVYIAFYTYLEPLYPILDFVDIIIMFDIFATLFTPYHLGSTIIVDPKSITQNYFDMSTLGYWNIFNPKVRSPRQSWRSNGGKRVFEVDFHTFLTFPSPPSPASSKP